MFTALLLASCSLLTPVTRACAHRTSPSSTHTYPRSGSSAVSLAHHALVVTTVDTWVSCVHVALPCGRAAGAMVRVVQALPTRLTAGKCIHISFVPQIAKGPVSAYHSSYTHAHTPHCALQTPSGPVVLTPAHQTLTLTSGHTMPIPSMHACRAGLPP